MNAADAREATLQAWHAEANRPSPSSALYVELLDGIESACRLASWSVDASFPADLYPASTRAAVTERLRDEDGYTVADTRDGDYWRVRIEWGPPSGWIMPPHPNPHSAPEQTQGDT